MNTQHLHPLRHITITPLVIGQFVLFAALSGVLSAPAAVAAEGTKAYTLFEGDNITVGQGTEMHPVRDVNGGSWVIVVNGKEVLVSATSGPINMKVTPVQKLSDISVTLANAKAERAYTYQNDPAVRLTRSMSQGAVTSAGYQAAVSQAAAAQSGAIMAPSANSSTNPSNTGNVSVNSATVADQSMKMATNGPGADLRFGANEAEGDFDALDVSFEISSSTPLRSPYIVTMTRIHETGSPAGSFRNVVSARALEPVTLKAAKVHYQQAGFPPGYQLEDHEIHLYDNGREVATNLSPKRQVLTFDQAFAYVHDKYIETHKTATLPAVAVMGDLPHDFPTQVATGKYAAPVYVTVSKEGLGQEAFSDLACKNRTDDPYLETVVHGIRFQPALEAGKPVDGVVSLDLKKLRM